MKKEKKKRVKENTKAQIQMSYGSWFGHFKRHFGVNWANMNVDRV